MFENLETVHVRQAEIEHDDIDPIAAELAQRVLRIFGFDDLVSLGRQTRAKEPPYRGFIIDHKNL
jgi:hypothetical protein